MLQVFKASGEEVFSIDFEEFVAMSPESKQPLSARALKRHLQRASGQSRFKQRLLLLDGRMLSDDFVFTGPTDVQLILHQFEASSQEQIRHLRDAASSNDIQTMEQLLQRPQDPDLQVDRSPPHQSAPALHLACGQGHTEAAHLLLEAKADKDRAYANSSTPMHFACQRGHVEVVRLLLEANADKNKAPGDGNTPLLTASQAGHLDVIVLLLEAKADKDKATEKGFTPLIMASYLGHVEVVLLLLEASADLDKAADSGATPLIMASKNGHTDVVRLLLEANADKDQATNNGATPLRLASEKRHLDVVHLLLAGNADKEKTDNHGETRLQSMAQLRSALRQRMAAWKSLACCSRRTPTRTRLQRRAQPG